MKWRFEVAFMIDSPLQVEPATTEISAGSGEKIEIPVNVIAGENLSPASTEKFALEALLTPKKKNRAWTRVETSIELTEPFSFKASPLPISNFPRFLVEVKKQSGCTGEWDS